MDTNFKIPNNAVVLMVGVAGSGKSTIAKKVFGDTALIVSSDECRKEICGDEKDQTANAQVFELFYKRIEQGVIQSKQVIADATNLDRLSRQKIYDIAKSNNVPVYAVVFNFPIEVIKKQNKIRERVVPEYAIDKMFEKMKKAYYQICEEIPNENIIDIIPSNSQIQENSEEVR